MKKILFATSALALLMGISASCQKEIEPLQGDYQNSEFTITATIADNGSKVSYAEDASNNLKPTWQVDDIVIGFDGSGNTYGYKVTSVDGTGKATMAIITSGDYVGSATTDPTDGTKMYMIYAPGKKPSNISSKSLTVSLANQSKDVIPALMAASATVSGSSLSLSFKNKTAIIAIKNPTMAAASTSYTSITLMGTGINTEVKFDLDGSDNLQATYQTPGTITKALEFTSDGSKAVSGITYIVACPISSSTDLTFVTNYLETFKKTGKTIAAGNYYYTTPTFAGGHADGLLSGVFSVSATKVVGFSKGNLQYQASTGTWQFATNQYDVIGNAAGNTTTTGRETQSGWIDLFGWGATGQNINGQQPYSISTTNSDYKTVATVAADETLTIANKADWGYCMGGATSVWRTMSGGSSGEWYYLMNSRTGVTIGSTVDARYAEVKVNSIAGMLIFPDVFTWPSDVTTKPSKFNASSSNWNDVNYTIADFKKLESAGCVFLPAAGYRSSSSVTNAGTYGYYWSSSANSVSTAYYLRFYNIDVNTSTNYNRKYGCSVRLVTAAQ